MKKLLVFLFIIFMSLIVKAQLPDKSLICGYQDNTVPVYIKQMMQNIQLPVSGIRQKAEPLKELRVWMIVDSTIYGFYQADTNKIKAHIFNVYKECNIVFEKELGIHVNVVAIEILKKGKNFNFKTRGAVDEYAQFYNFTNAYINRKDISRDITVLWSQYTGEPYGGVAGGPEGKFQHDIGSKLDPFIILHETGHNLGSPHTHNCYWAGGPIDVCNDPEGGNCYTGAKTSDTGTIMSYCVKYNIGGYNVFHPLCIQLIKQVVSESLKLPAIISPPLEKVTLLFPNNGKEHFYPGTYFSWKATEKTFYYQLQVSNKPDFTNLSVDISISNNNYLFSITLSRNELYYWRVRSVNSAGSGIWSEIFSFKTQEELILQKPIINEVTNLRTNGEQIISFSPVSNAIGYEIAFHISDGQEMSNINEYKRIKTSLINMKLSDLLSFPKDAGYYRWRIRALADNNFEGEWSDDDIITYRNRISLYDNVSLIDYEYSYYNIPYKLPTSFPLNSSNDFSWLDELRKYKLEVADNIDFKNPIITKEQTNNFAEQPYAPRNSSIMVENLEIDKKYYFRLNVKSRIDSAIRTGEFITGAEERWKLQNYSNTTSLPSKSYIRGIFVDKDNNRWLYGISGIYIIRPDGSITTYNINNTNNDLPNTINDITQDTQGRIWVATSDGLGVLENNKWTIFRKGIFGKNLGGYIWYNGYNKIKSGPNNTLYAYGDGLNNYRILRYDGLNWKNITPESGYSSDLFDLDQKGNLWFFSYKDYKIRVYENNVWSEVKIDEISGNSKFNMRIIDNKNRMWFINYEKEGKVYIVSDKENIKIIDGLIEVIESTTGRKYKNFLQNFMIDVKVTEKYTYYFGAIGFLEYDGIRYIYYNYPINQFTILSIGNNFAIDKNGTPLFLDNGVNLYQFNRNNFNGFLQKQVNSACDYSFRIGIATTPPNGTEFKVYISDSTAATFKELKASYQNGYINFSIPGDLKGKGYRIKYSFGDWLESKESEPFEIGLPFLNLTIIGSNTFCYGTSTVLKVDVSGGKEPYSYEWSNNGGIQNTFMASTNGIYNVTVKDARGCVQSSPPFSLTNKGLKDGTITVSSGITTVYEPQSVIISATTGLDISYQWQKNNVDIINAVTDTYEAKESGSYTVKMLKDDCVTQSAPINVTVHKVLAIENIAIPEHLSFSNSPNPFEKITNINFGLPKKSDVTINLFNENGQLVKFITEESFLAGWHSLKLDFKDLSAGTYMCRLKTQYETKVIKILVQ